MLEVNADLVGKVVNIASRCAGFITSLADGRWPLALPEPALYDQFISGATQVAESYETRHFSSSDAPDHGVGG